MTDFTLWTDGSGYQDGFSGYCAIARCNIKGLEQTQMTMGGFTASTVARAEMSGLLEGVELIRQMVGKMPQYNLAGQKVTVEWFSDREDLVKSVKNEYGRKSSPDLWARFENYEREMTVFPTWVSRDSGIPEMLACDMHASTLRCIVKDYCAAFKEEEGESGC